MTQTKVVCDLCGVAVEQGIVVKIKAGSLRQRFREAFDLCLDSGSLCADFI
jgi:hypothetical protein